MVTGRRGHGQQIGEGDTVHQFIGTVHTRVIADDGPDDRGVTGQVFHWNKTAASSVG